MVCARATGYALPRDGLRGGGDCCHSAGSRSKGCDGMCGELDVGSAAACDAG